MLQSCSPRRRYAAARAPVAQWIEQRVLPLGPDLWRFSTIDRQWPARLWHPLAAFGRRRRSWADKGSRWRVCHLGSDSADVTREAHAPWKRLLRLVGFQ